MLVHLSLNQLRPVHNSLNRLKGSTRPKVQCFEGISSKCGFKYNGSKIQTQSMKFLSPIWFDDIVQ